MNVQLTLSRRSVSLPLAFAVALLGVAAMSVLYPSMTEASPDTPVPVESAESSADHLKLAEYFDQQALDAEERFKRHKKLQEGYQKTKRSLQSLPINQGGSVSLSIVRHCEILVENARRDVDL